MNLVLVKENNTEKNKKISIEKENFVIGRQSGVDLKLEDVLVSRTHAEIKIEKGRACIRDLESRNRTFVNGTPIEEFWLADGDEIQMGNSILIFRNGTGTEIENYEEEDIAISKIFESYENPLINKGVTEFRKNELVLVNQKLLTLYKIGNIINARLNVEEVLEKIMDEIFAVINAERGSILLWNEENKELEVAINRGRNIELLPSNIQYSKTIIKQVFKNKKAILTLDAKDDSRFQSGQSIIAQNIRSAMCVPISAKEKILGIIYLDTNQIKNAFNEKDLELLSAIGMQAGIALENARLYTDLKEIFISAIASLASAIEAKDPYTKGHSERVSYFSEGLAQKVGLSPKECNDAKIAGLLHDIGKIGVPESILNKQGKIDEEEMKVIERHPKMSYEIIAKMKGLRHIAFIAKHHHERIDGTGYPDKLIHKEIPLISRIICIADTYDALTSDRIYRDKLNSQEALDYLRKHSGKIFDKELVQAFENMIGERELSSVSKKEDFLRLLGIKE